LSSTLNNDPSSCCFETDNYSAAINPVSAVPGPVVGAGLPGLILSERWPSRQVATAEEDCLSYRWHGVFLVMLVV
jgi:hypothetical protein